MIKKLAKLKYLPNNFQIIEPGDYVVCAVSGKEISLDKLSYWNYKSHIIHTEKHLKEEKKLSKINLFPTVVRPYPLFWSFHYHFFKNSV